MILANNAKAKKLLGDKKNAVTANQCTCSNCNCNCRFSANNNLKNLVGIYRTKLA